MKNRKVKITDKQTGEIQYFLTPLKASQALGFKYITIIAWLNKRIENDKYMADYELNDIK